MAEGLPDAMFGGVINRAAVEENWDEVLRLAASIRAGTVPPSIILKKLATFPRQNALHRALREMGRLERAIFTCDWLLDPDLRRRSNDNLNKGESRHALARAVFFHRLGELRDRTAEDMAHRASGLNLVVMPSCCGTPRIWHALSPTCVARVSRSPTRNCPTSPRYGGTTSRSPECAPAGGQIERLGLTTLAELPEDGSHDETSITQRSV